MVIYLLHQNVSASTKKAIATLFEGEPFNPLVFTEGEAVEVSAKDIYGSLEKTVLADGNLELTENEFLRYQSIMIDCVDV